MIDEMIVQGGEDWEKEEMWEDIPEESVRELVGKIERRELVLSFSSMKSFAPPYGSPRRFVYSKLKKSKETAAMIFGDLLDCMVTEDEEELGKRFAVVPAEINRRTKEGKEKFERFMKENEGKKLVTEKELATAQMMARRLWSCRESRFVLEKATEVQVWFGKKDESGEGGFNFMGWDWRGKADFLGKDVLSGEMVADLKVMARANPKTAKWVILDEMYREQLVLYKTAFFGNDDRAAMYTVGVERSGEVFVCEYGKRDYELGLKRWEEIMEGWEMCVLMGDWERSYGFWAEFEKRWTRGVFNFGEL